MREILDILPKIWATKRAKSLKAASAEGAEPAGSRRTSEKPKLNRVTRNYVKLIKSLHNIRTRFTIENFRNTKRALTAKEVTISRMYQEIYKKESVEYELSFLVVAVEILIDIYSMCDDLTKAEEWCKMNQKFMKGVEEDPRYIITAMRTWQQFGAIYADLHPKTCYTILLAALYLYKVYTKTENYPAPVAYDYLFTDEDKNPDDILDSLQIVTIGKLIYLCKFHMFDTYEFVAYMHELLRDTIEEAVLLSGYIEWSITCAKLAFYFMGRKRFCETRNHLITAIKVLVECNNAILNANKDQDTNSKCEVDVTKFSYYKQTLYSIYLIWIQYGIQLLRSSREKFVHGEIANNSHEDNSNSADLLLFDKGTDLVFQCHEAKAELDFTSFPNQYLVNYDDAKKLYSNCWMKNYEATSFFRAQKDFYHLAEVALYFSRLCKYLAELEVDSSIEWHTTRLQNLEYIIKETGKSTDPYVKRIRRILWLELGLAHCAYLETEERMATRTGENLTKNTARTLYGPAKKVLECFEAFRAKS